jgi:hypothetical protein
MIDDRKREPGDNSSDEPDEVFWVALGLEELVDVGVAVDEMAAGSATRIFFFETSLLEELAF